MRTPTARARGVSRFREIPAQGEGLEPSRQYQAVHQPPQCDPSENAALHANLAFLPAGNERIPAYYKWNDDRSNLIIVVANLDVHLRQESFIHLPLAEMGLEPGAAFTVEDLMWEEVYHWKGGQLCLARCNKPVHILRLVRHKA
ncbi:MAG: hypothetical protein R3F31_23650 [Verrucomicrobiales bacterium]